jgi:osmoprotectant transport system permease protein
MNTFLDALGFLRDHPGLIWEKVVEHLQLSGAAIGVALLIAIPIGVTLGHLHRGSFIAINAANIGRALPSLALISIGLGFLGIGFVNVMVAMVILAVPPLMTNAYVAVDQVDADAVEAARGMGMRPSQVLTKIELPLALPLIFAGMRTAVVYVIATGTLAAIAGGGGLGDIIFNQPSYHLSGVIAGSMVIAALAFSAEGIFAVLQRSLTPRGIRGTGEETDALMIGPAVGDSARGELSQV